MIHNDLNPPQRSTCRKKKKFPFLILLLVSLGALLLTLNRPTVTETEAHITENSSPPSPAESPSAIPLEPEIREEIVDGEIQPGDTITSLLGDYFTPLDIHNLARDSSTIFPLSNICAGQPYKICLTDGHFEQFEYEIDRDNRLIIRRDEDGFDITKEEIPYTVETQLIRGEITSSLFDAVSSIGEEPEFAIRLANIFAYDIDFIRDIRSGDTFKAVVEKRFREGQPAGYGKILAAEFTNQGRSFEAFWFKDGDKGSGYYDSKGKSLRSAFLRAPLDYSRISSGYTLRRFHPIAKTWRAHPAIDYAAPTGTPIKTVGDGTIYRIGRTRGNGNYIKIRHPNGYTTMYLHMSHFARGMKKGKRVAQGDIIGYVGSTGLATGPHLCFRMQKNGAPVNPTRVRTTSGPPISQDHIAQYKQTIAPLASLLEGGSVHQAMAETSGGEASETR